MLRRDPLPISSILRPRRDFSALGRALLLIVLLAAGFLAAGFAKAADGPSGLPLPRFATTKSDPINVRVGPGTRYDVAWTYVKAGMPVEIIQEFDTWRKIRDVDGSEGWVHQNLLSGRRAGIAAPWQQDTQIALRPDRNSEGVRAYLGPGYRVEISKCDGTWCEVSAAAASATYQGFLPQSELWGVYQGEEFD
jgi:SH3-like domain-containing protein